MCGYNYDRQVEGGLRTNVSMPLSLRSYFSLVETKVKFVNGLALLSKTYIPPLQNRHREKLPAPEALREGTKFSQTLTLS